ncbi:MAG: aminotransferase class I/II-fold pyridoxal phosphate-dependent enzyme [Oscillospiraceae bacterium]
MATSALLPCGRRSSPAAPTCGRTWRPTIRNRKALQESLTEMGYRMASPDGAFYLFIQAPNGDDLAFSEMAKKKNLLLVPGTGFDCPGWFRICYCVSYDMIQRSLPVFRELMEACR